MNTVVTFGEIMLRLKSPGAGRLLQEPLLESTFGGGEANVAVSLAQFGVPASFVSAVPENSLGEAVVGTLRRYGVDTTHISYRSGRLGIYFLEGGAAQRPSTVLYDRENSAFSQVHPGDFDWLSIFSAGLWFHTSGITPALSPSAAETVLEAVLAAKHAGIPVSIDLNYRKKLWNYGKTAPEVMRSLVAHADVLIANEEDIQKCLGISNSEEDSHTVDLDGYRRLTDKVLESFPGLSHVAVTLREAVSADTNFWSAVLATKNTFLISQKYAITDIVDRVGAGDSFSAGLIYGMLKNPNDEKYALEFATAASCLKHSISGDFNLSKKEEVEALLGGNASGRIQR
ncbi:MAG TPA: sugar kinase [Treponema sp.]|nr:sugar kinase [Treponema sp.]